jgi:hypothetical protein
MPTPSCSKDQIRVFAVSPIIHDSDTASFLRARPYPDLFKRAAFKNCDHRARSSRTRTEPQVRHHFGEFGHASASCPVASGHSRYLHVGSGATSGFGRMRNRSSANALITASASRSGSNHGISRRIGASEWFAIAARPSQDDAFRVSEDCHCKNPGPSCPVLRTRAE